MHMPTMSEPAERSHSHVDTTVPLTPLLSQRFALTLGQLAMCGLFVLFLLYLSYIPLFHSDIWGHVEYGRWILEHHALPAEDPFLPLAEGMRVVDNAWLSQVVLAWVEMHLGTDGLCSLFGLVV